MWVYRQAEFVWLSRNSRTESTRLSSAPTSIENTLRRPAESLPSPVGDAPDPCYTSQKDQ